MTDFNPLAGSILGSTQAQHQVDIEKQRQARRAQTVSKNVAARDDELEHQVESSEELPPVGDEPDDQRQRDQRQKQKPDPDKDDGHPHIDLTA
jgi:hypothetical protein